MLDAAYILTSLGMGAWTLYYWVKAQSCSPGIVVLAILAGIMVVVNYKIDKRR